MPAVLAAPWLGTAIAGAAGAGATIAAAKMGTSAANKAARMTTDASNRAAELQTQSTREALDFQRQQAALDRQREEANRRADYDQWAAQRRRMNSLADLLGFRHVEIPDYVPLPGEHGQPRPQGAPMGNLDEARAKFDALFPGETLTPDMVKAKEAELKAAGFTLRPNAKGAVGKIQYGTGPIIDIIQGADSGVNKKQWLLPSAAAAPARLMAARPAYVPRSRMATRRSLYDFVGAA